MTFGGATVYLEECRVSLLEGDARGALVFLKEASQALTEASNADMYRRFQKHNPRAQAHKDAYAKATDPDVRSFHMKRAAHHDDKAMRRSFPALKKDEDAPIAWSGSNKDYKSKVGDFLKRTGRKALGMKGRARSDAQHAYDHGQAALAHTQKLAHDSEKFAKKAGRASRDAEKFASKGKDDRAANLKAKADHDTEKAVSAHNQGVKMHQAAMTGFQRTMNTANKEGDRETADWAAKAGAVHTNNRAWHMQQGSNIRKWAQGAQSQKAPEKTSTSSATSPAAKPASAHASDKAHAAKVSDDYKAHMAKMAARKAAPKVSPTVGKPPTGRKPAAVPLRRIKSDTAGATKTG